MKIFKDNKGITLISVIAYVILALIILGILATITTSFRGNVQDMNAKTVQDVEFDKLNVQLLKETKDETNTINADETDETKVVFTNGNKYTYIESEKTIYLNDNIKVAENIESCKFEIKTQENILNENTQYIDKNGDVAMIPAGFMVSGVESERTIQNGLVIYCGVPDSTISLKTTVKVKGVERITEYILANDGSVDWSNGTSVAEGQKTYDQFVWIPIKNTTDANAQDINDMYICQGKTGSNGVCEIKVVNEIAECQTEAHKTLADDGITYKNTLMAGRLYASNTKLGNNFEAEYTEVYTSGSKLREPDTVSEYDSDSEYLTHLSSILGTTGYESVTNFKSSLQSEYNEIVKSVYENQGFYVGRYETSNMTTTDGNAVKVVAETTSGIESIGWYHMYAQQKDYAKNKKLTVGSTMIQGAAYDQVMKFVDPNNTWIKTTGRVSHDLGNKNYYQTGGLNYNGTITYTDESKNIYDLEGNVKAWTTEALDNKYRVNRGGSYNHEVSASSRYKDHVTALRSL